MNSKNATQQDDDDMGVSFASRHSSSRSFSSSRHGREFRGEDGNENRETMQMVVEEEEDIESSTMSASTVAAAHQHDNHEHHHHSRKRARSAASDSSLSEGRRHSFTTSSSSSLTAGSLAGQSCTADAHTNPGGGVEQTSQMRRHSYSDLRTRRNNCIPPPSLPLPIPGRMARRSHSMSSVQALSSSSSQSSPITTPFRTRLHCDILVGDWTSARLRLKTHPHEMATITPEAGVTPLDYAMTMEAPVSFIRDLLASDTKLCGPWTYSRAGELTIHRACRIHVKMENLCVLLECRGSRHLATARTLTARERKESNRIGSCRWMSEGAAWKMTRESSGSSGEEDEDDMELEEEEYSDYLSGNNIFPMNERATTRQRPCEAKNQSMECGSIADQDMEQRGTMALPWERDVERSLPSSSSSLFSSGSELLNSSKMATTSDRSDFPREVREKVLFRRKRHSQYRTHHCFFQGAVRTSFSSCGSHGPDIHHDDSDDDSFTPFDCTFFSRADRGEEARRMFLEVASAALQDGVGGRRSPPESAARAVAIERGGGRKDGLAKHLEVEEQSMHGDNNGANTNRTNTVEAGVSAGESCDEQDARSDDIAGNLAECLLHGTDTMLSPLRDLYQRLCLLLHVAYTNTVPPASSPSTSPLIVHPSPPVGTSATNGPSSPSPSSPLPSPPLVMHPHLRILHACLLVQCTSLEMLLFAIRAFPGELMMRDQDGNLPLHLACNGGANRVRNRRKSVITVHPRRRGWKLGGGDNDEEDRERDKKNKRRGELVIPILLKAWDGAAKMVDMEGRLPLHLALEVGHRFHRWGGLSTTAVVSSTSIVNKTKTNSNGYGGEDSAANAASGDEVEPALLTAETASSAVAETIRSNEEERNILIDSDTSIGNMEDVGRQRRTTESIYDTGIQSLLAAYPEAIDVRDPKTGLFPFMLAATAASSPSPTSSFSSYTTNINMCSSASSFPTEQDDNSNSPVGITAAAEVNTIYELLLMNPDLVTRCKYSL